MACLHNKFRLWADLFSYNLRGRKEFAKHDFDVFLCAKERLEKYFGGRIHDKEILDIGCGQRYPNVLLFSTLENRVVGIDMEVVGRRLNIRKYLKILRIHGVEKLVKVAAREILFDGLYYQILEKISGMDLNRNIDIRLGDATDLPVESSFFDIVISNSTFEHISNVSKAVSELQRVLKYGGLCHIEIHLFTSLSGGHNLKWAFPDEDPPPDVPPWDHLREDRFPAHVYLNKLREHEYREIFDDNLEILDWLTEYWEGEKFLTPEIESELSEYSREELLKRSIIVIAKKI